MLHSGNTVHCRATSALKLTFEVPKSLRKHMELLPKTGFVQAQSSFSAQLKFLPRATLAEDAPEFFDKETGVLEVPLAIHVADQVLYLHTQCQGQFVVWLYEI